jgi:hypothetical protein
MGGITRTNILDELFYVKKVNESLKKFDQITIKICECVSSQNSQNISLRKIKSYKWYNGYDARLGCGRSLVPVSAVSIKYYKIGICCFLANHAVRYGRNYAYKYFGWIVLSKKGQWILKKVRSNYNKNMRMCIKPNFAENSI